MVVLLFLLSPVLVELVDFNSCVALLKQVKSLCGTRKRTFVSKQTLQEEGGGKSKDPDITL